MKLTSCKIGIVYLKLPSVRSSSVNSSMVRAWWPTATEGLPSSWVPWRWSLWTGKWCPWSSPGTQWWRSLWSLWILPTGLVMLQLRGQSTSISGDLPVIRDLVISCNPGGDTFSLAPRSSSSWGAGSEELPGKAELEVSLRAHCSSSRRHWALLLTGATVAAAPSQVSWVGGNIPHRGHHMRWMYFDPFQIF